MFRNPTLMALATAQKRIFEYFLQHHYRFLQLVHGDEVVVHGRVGALARSCKRRRVQRSLHGSDVLRQPDGMHLVQVRRSALKLPHEVGCGRSPSSRVRLRFGTAVLNSRPVQRRLHGSDVLRQPDGMHLVQVRRSALKLPHEVGCGRSPSSRFRLRFGSDSECSHRVSKCST